jgi:hypothetical protein
MNTNMNISRGVGKIKKGVGDMGKFGKKGDPLHLPCENHAPSKFKIQKFKISGKWKISGKISFHIKEMKQNPINPKK